MGPLSRFEKIESSRPAKEPEPATEPARFLATEVPGPPPASGGAPPVELPEEPRPADGDLDRLPTLVCDRCGAESSKFDTHCRTCGSRLDSPGARALNLERLAGFDADAAEQTARAEAQLRGLQAASPQVLGTPRRGLGLQVWLSWALGLALLAALPRWAQVLVTLGALGALVWRAWRGR
jgi:hypothetical protein